MNCDTRETAFEHPRTGLPVLPLKPPAALDDDGKEWFVAIKNNSVEKVRVWITKDSSVIR